MSKKNEILHYDITVRGRVQGVGFRYSAESMARSLGIKGYVRNLSGGAVALEIEGSKMATDLMISWCEKGPGTGRVKDISIHSGPVKAYDTFRIAYSGR